MTTVKGRSNAKEVARNLHRLPRRLTEAQRRTVLASEKKGLELLKRPTLTWRHPVYFDSKIKGIPGGFILELSTTDPPYSYLNFGTKVRRALMSPDWASKTTPGTLNASAGGGRVLVIGSHINQPGIEKRDFVGLALNELRPFAHKIHQVEIRAEAKRRLS